MTPPLTMPAETGSTLIQHYAEVRARLYGRSPVVARPIPRPKPMLAIQQKPLEPLPEAETPVPLNMLAPCSWRFLVALAAAKHGQSVDDILSPARVLPVAQARHEAVYLIVLHTTYSIARVARLFGRDHTTALNSLRKFPKIKRTGRHTPYATVEPFVRSPVPGIPEGASVMQAIETGYSKGLSVEVIAMAVGSTPGSIKAQASKAGIRHPSKLRYGLKPIQEAGL